MGWEDVARDHELMPKTVDHDFWQTYLADHPEVMHRLLGDIYNATASNPNRLPTVDELRRLVTTDFSTDDFSTAVQKLLGDRSVRWLAAQMKVHHDQVLRILNGKRQIVLLRDPAGSMYRIEAFARALRVHPAHFVEWRRLWILSLIDDAFTVQPNLSIGVYRRFSGHQPEAPHQKPMNGR